MRKLIATLIAGAALAAPASAFASAPAPGLVIPHDTVDGTGALVVYTNSLPVSIPYSLNVPVDYYNGNVSGQTTSGTGCDGYTDSGWVWMYQPGGGVFPFDQANGNVPCGVITGPGAVHLYAQPSFENQVVFQSYVLFATSNGGGVNYMFGHDSFPGVKVKANRWVTNSAGKTVRRYAQVAYTYDYNHFTFQWDYRNNAGSRVKSGTYHMHVSFTSAVQTSNTLNKKVVVG